MTNLSRILISGVVGAILVVTGVAVGSVHNSVPQQPVVVTRTVVVTPTSIPTATPSAVLKSRIGVPASVTKTVK